MNKLQNTKGLLIDLDGTIYVGENVIDGAVEAIEQLRRKNIPFRFTTNTTTCSTRSLCEKLRQLGIPVDKREFFGTIDAAVRYLRQHDSPKCYLLLSDDPMEDFAEFPKSQDRPDFVVIGDIGKLWDYDLMNRVFHMLHSGARLVALHKGKFWQTKDGLRMDIGAFVAGLEYVSGQTAVVIGKPSKQFYNLAVEELGLVTPEVAMIGDDIESDVGGAQSAGLIGLLVKTGKYRQESAANSSVKPDLLLSSICELPKLLG